MTTGTSRDAAEMHEASHWPQIGDGLDSVEDLVREFVAERVPGLPPVVELAWIRKKIALVTVAYLEHVRETGELARWLGEAGGKADLEIVARLLAELIDDKQPRLQARCIDFVMGTNVGGGRDETQIAELEGVGKAAVSARCIRLREVFGLPKAPGMKSDQARESYAKRQTGRRNRPKREAWKFSNLLSTVYAEPAAAAL